MAPRAVVAVSTVSTGLAGSLGFLFGFLAPALQADLGLSRGQVGLLVGLFFGATGLGSAVCGVLADRLGARWAVVADMLLVVACLLVAVALPGYWVLAAAGVAAGFGYALTNAGTNIAVAAVLPAERHGVAMAAKTAGVPLVVVVGSLLAAGLVEQLGWRGVLALVLPLPLLTAALAWRVLPDARAPRPEPGSAPLRLPRSFGWFPLAAFLLIFGTQALYSWMVPFLHEATAVSLPVAGALTAAGSLVAVGGMIVAARGADRVGGATRLPAIVLLCLVSAGGIALLAAGAVTGVGLAASGLVVATVAQLAAISLLHAAIVAVAPAAVGRASGVMMSGYYLGALFAPPLFGIVVDRAGYLPAWLGCLVLVLAAAGCFWRCRAVQPAQLVPA